MIRSYLRPFGVAALGIAFSFTASFAAEVIEADVCIYGGTSGGVAAAVQAARMGKSVVIAEPGRHLGGMTSGGLSAVDIGDPRSVGGISREYFTKLAATVGIVLAWDKAFVAKGGGPATGGAYAIEPHKAEEVYAQMAEEAGVKVHFKARLAKVIKSGARITEFITEEGTTFRAKMFLDTTYEGDLMAKAGVSYTLMREGNAKYGETYNGIYYDEKYIPRTGHLQPGETGRVTGGQGVWDRDFPLDPYVVKGDPKSGLLPLIQEGEPGKPGEPAPGVQAYCFRLCLSVDPANSIAITPPSDYDPKRYEIVARFIEACLANGDDMDLRWFSKHDALPNQKWDFNTATFGGNMPGASHEWPEASYARRDEIAKEHENYHRGLLHFLATDSRVPEKVRNDMKRFGLPKDEFTDNGGWPHQIYVREARRMVSDLILTEHHTFGREIAPKSVSLGSYGTDTHEIRRIVKDGVVIREGKTAGGRDGFGPYQIGYDCIVPKQSECENLFVTFALSCSHTAFSSLRMEPVFMVTSQSAATAAVMAIEDDLPVQKVDYEKLRSRLEKDGQVLTWKFKDGGH
ncbi:FAD dependent oxidoreductase [Prosthecobacter fusiformis]|uniref:FAD dependent oxidoreductase n=1 Tax=Prosthecobacter fusiformis TaxID=48464 RepID=A0A4R7S6J4_9BACT|nr:FAD-dependent oxidoreductase [Prosthecobacter fusiformis]TDU73065.1 FAD dependent oxidoreductase [Prosthecobacter fusiformis]